MEFSTLVNRSSRSVNACKMYCMSLAISSIRSFKSVCRLIYMDEAILVRNEKPKALDLART